MDYHETLFGPQLVDIEVPSEDTLRLAHGRNFPPPMHIPSAFMQHVATVPSDYPATSMTGFYPTTNTTVASLQSQGVSDQDRLMFAGDAEDGIDFDAFLDSLNTFPPAYISSDRSTTTSTMSSSHDPSAQNVHSSSETTSVDSNDPYAKPTIATNFSCRRALEKEMETLCSNNRQSCLSYALETLRALHIPPTACISSTGDFSTTNGQRQPRMVGAVLEINRSTVRHISEILECSCISSTPLQLVLVTICDKLIAWYQAVLDSFVEHCNETKTRRITQASSRYNDTTGTAARKACEQVVHQPFSVGDFAFDQDLEGRVREQVIVSELQQLDILVTNLMDCLRKEHIYGNNSQLRNESNSPHLITDSSAASKGAHISLCEQLQKRLRDTKAQTVHNG
ncbi:MAG: hypothetical protein Q9216_004702 [Gyalolechia sp. 2 TL-2023]